MAGLAWRSGEGAAGHPSGCRAILSEPVFGFIIDWRIGARPGRIGARGNGCPVNEGEGGREQGSAKKQHPRGPVAHSGVREQHGSTPCSPIIPRFPSRDSATPARR